MFDSENLRIDYKFLDWISGLPKYMYWKKFYESKGVYIFFSLVKSRIDEFFFEIICEGWGFL